MLHTVPTVLPCAPPSAHRPACSHLRVLVSSVESDAAEQKKAEAQAGGAASAAPAGGSGQQPPGRPQGADMDVDMGRAGAGGANAGGGGVEGVPSAAEGSLPAELEAGLAAMLAGVSGPDFSCLGVRRDEAQCGALASDPEGLHSVRAERAQGKQEDDAVRSYSHAVVHFNSAMTAFKSALEVGR